MLWLWLGKCICWSEWPVIDSWPSWERWMLEEERSRGVLEEEGLSWGVLERWAARSDVLVSQPLHVISPTHARVHMEDYSHMGALARSSWETWHFCIRIFECRLDSKHHNQALVAAGCWQSFWVLSLADYHVQDSLAGSKVNKAFLEYKSICKMIKKRTGFPWIWFHFQLCLAHAKSEI